jgi:hypothetical protein
MLLARDTRHWNALVLGLLLSGSASAQSDCRIRLIDVTKETGVRFVHSDGASGQRYIVETVAAGMALFDYDNDGLIDIYFLNGAPLKGTVVSRPLKNALYRNLGNWTFADVTEAAGVGDAGYGLGVVAGDYDSDGDLDLYISNFGRNVLYVNNGDGTFHDGTAQAKLRLLETFGAGSAFFDMDADGDLDLYSANYVDFGYDKHSIRMIGKYAFHKGPRSPTSAMHRGWDACERLAWGYCARISTTMGTAISSWPMISTRIFCSSTMGPGNSAKKD